MRLAKLFFLIAFLIVFSYACFETTTTTAVVPRTVDHSYRLPIFKPLDQKSLSQAKGGIRISISPIDYKVDTMKMVVEELTEPPLISIKPAAATKYVKVTEYDKLIYVPENIVFKLNINNTLSRVFRGAGSVVQINWCQKFIETKYNELTDLILTPGGQAEITIYGPPVSEWLNTACNNNIIGIFIYDVVTQMDQAGNIKEKQNFEWYFKVDFEEKVITLSAPQTSYRWK
jgi:hypothetical protein